MINTLNNDETCLAVDKYLQIIADGKQRFARGNYCDETSSVLKRVEQRIHKILQVIPTSLAREESFQSDLKFSSI